MKKLIIYVNLIFFGLAISGCSEEFLNRPPLDRVVAASFYKTQEDFERAVTSVYDVLQYQSVGSWAPYSFIQDLLSDDTFAGGSDANDGLENQQLNTFNIPTNNAKLQSIWERNYIGIFRANLVMERLQDVELDPDFEARSVAECKFLRAYFYFEQVKYFENIPLILQTIGGPSEFAQTQNTPKEVYDQIAMDLVQTINEPTIPGDLPTNELGRINKWAAKALLARVFLFYNGVYGQNLEVADDGTGQAVTIDATAAFDHLEDIIGESYHSLTPSYDDIFHIANEWGPESVFEIGHGDTPQWWDWNYTVGGEGNLASQLQGPRVTGSTLYNRGWSFGTVSEKLARDMTGDPRFNSTILTEDSLRAAAAAANESNFNLVIGYQHTGYYSMKYSSDAEHWGSQGQFELNRTTNFRVIRYADVLLMAAELGQNVAYLNEVRARVGLAPIAAYSDQAVWDERRLELALEGVRYFDLIRTQRFDELTVVGDRGPGYTEDQVAYDVTFPTATRGFLPIPQNELDLAEGRFNQNNGW